MNSAAPTPADHYTARQLLGLYLAASAIVLALWWTPFGYPLVLFATLVHELGHLCAAVLTGGEVFSIGVETSGAGHVIQLGGARWAVSPAGYMGTLVCAALLFWCGGSPSSTRLALGILLALLLVYVVASARSFIVLFVLGSLTFGVAAVLWTGSAFVQSMATRFLALGLAIEGVASLWQVLFAFEHVRERSVWEPVERMPVRGEFYTDATLMAASYGGSEGLWAVIWLVLSLIVLATGVWWSIRDELRTQEEGLRHAALLKRKWEQERMGQKEYRVR